jgi:hypothetical protein
MNCVWGQPVKHSKLKRIILLAFAGTLLMIACNRIREYINWRQRDDIVARVKRGEIQFDRDHRATLPGGLFRCIAGNYIYLISPTRKPLILFFPTDIQGYSVAWDDKHVEPRFYIAGYLYTDTPVSGHKGFDIGSPSSGIDTVSNEGAGPVRPHWSYVEPFYSD